MNTKNVLIFPGGTEIGLEIARSLKNIKWINVFSAASNTTSHHAPYYYQCNSVISDISNPTQALNDLLEICTKFSIDIVYPANPLVIDFLVNNRDIIPALLALPSTKVVKMTRSKLETYRLLGDLVPTPIVYNSLVKANELTNCSYPLFIKPNSMYGSQGVKVVTQRDLISIEDEQGIKDGNLVLSEYLPGDEYTVDCLSSSDEGLLFCQARIRARIRMGTSMHTYRASEEIQTIAKNIANIIVNEFKITGCWFFQLKADKNNVLKLLEVEARVAGTMCLPRAQGVNLPLLNIYVILNMPIKIFQQKSLLTATLDRALKTRFKLDIPIYNHVYVDLDDTLIIKGRFNYELIAFLYQCKDRKKQIHLISKSLHDNPVHYIEEKCLMQLFDSVNFIKESESKADYIKFKDSIFIDDSFSQRLEVHEKCQILTLDPTMLDSIKIEETL